MSNSAPLPRATAGRGGDARRRAHARPRSAAAQPVSRSHKRRIEAFAVNSCTTGSSATPRSGPIAARRRPSAPAESLAPRLRRLLATGANREAPAMRMPPLASQRRRRGLAGIGARAERGDRAVDGLVNAGASDAPVVEGPAAVEPARLAAREPTPKRSTRSTCATQAPPPHAGMPAAWRCRRCREG